MDIENIYIDDETLAWLENLVHLSPGSIHLLAVLRRSGLNNEWKEWIDFGGES